MFVKQTYFACFSMLGKHKQLAIAQIPVVKTPENVYVCFCCLITG